MSGQSLFAYLNSGVFAQRENHTEIASVIVAMARAAVDVRKMTTQGALNAAFATSRDERNADERSSRPLQCVPNAAFAHACCHRQASRFDKVHHQANRATV